MLGHEDEKMLIHTEVIFITYTNNQLLVSPSKLRYPLYMLEYNAKTTTSNLKLNFWSSL